MKYSIRFKIIILLGFLCFIGTSCNKKTGCPANEAASVKVKRNGELPTKRGKSGLFNKKMSKKMKRR